jgi:hypothetical protein
MIRNLRSTLRTRLLCVLTPATLLVACSDPRPPTATHTAAVVQPRVQVNATPVAAAIALGTTPLSVDEHGVPRLLIASTSLVAPAATATDSARIHIKTLAAAWGVPSGAVPALDAVGEVPVPGGTVARLRQVIDGLPVDGGELRVLVRKDGALVSVSGVLVGATTPRTTKQFLDDDAGAIARAITHAYKAPFDRAGLTQQRRRGDGGRVLTAHTKTIDVPLASAQQVWYPTGATLTAAWVVEAYASPATTSQGDAWHTVIAAADGKVLAHRSLVADAAFSYRVFAETTGELHPLDGPVVDPTPHATGVPNGLYPAYILPNLVSVEGLNHPGGGTVADPWLTPTATETKGNNVEVYTDFNAPDGFTFGDFRATTTAARTFDRTYDTAAPPLAQPQQMASITSLFYVMNWMHDFWYDAGFTETAANAQEDNYGRGGQDRDALLGEAQDNALGGSRNNANMSTPADGLPPRMQVFLWSGKTEKSMTLQPANRSPLVGTAAFGPQSFDVAAPVVLANDGTATLTDACSALTNNVTGKIVVADRGACTFKTKALNVQNAGAVGMILANNTASTSPQALGDDTTITTPITIATLSVLQSEGVTIKA